MSGDGPDEEGQGASGLPGLAGSPSQLARESHGASAAPRPLLRARAEDDPSSAGAGDNDVRRENPVRPVMQNSLAARELPSDPDDTNSHPSRALAAGDARNLSTRGEPDLRPVSRPTPEKPASGLDVSPSRTDRDYPPDLDAPSPEEQERMVEALLFASPAPLPTARIAERLPPGCDPRAALARLQRRYEGRGVNLVRSGGVWAFRTAPDLRFLLSREVVDTRKLSRAGIETLAIVAYHGPVTRTEIEEIRGVSVSKGTLDQLMELGWVRLGRRRETPGRPATYVTTDAFLDHFGLESATDLPSLADLRAAGFLGDPAIQQDLPLPDPDEG